MQVHCRVKVGWAMKVLVLGVGQIAGLSIR